MAGELVFGTDAVTPNTALADGSAVVRSGSDLVGSSVIRTIASGATAVLGSGTGGSSSTGSLNLTPSQCLITQPADTNTGQVPFLMRQGFVARLTIEGSNGAANALVLIGAGGGGANQCDLQVNGNSKIGNATTDKVGFMGTVPISRQVLATGAGHTVDDVITALQNLGLVSQT